MSIYHLNVQIIGRSTGRSSVAAAAYRAKEKIVDERTGLSHDYTKRKIEIESEILAPLSAPDWVFERKKLWNEVENIEKRKDSQLAREMNVALPKELSKEQNKELIKGYVVEYFVDKGMIADISIHWDKDNPHAHIMLTTREITQSGFDKKNRDWNDKALLESWRESWARSANKALSEANIHEQISHKSLKEQGIEREPQIHLGHAVVAMEKKGIKTDRGNIYRDIEEVNRKIIDIEEYKKQKEELIEADRHLGLDYELNKDDREFLEPIRDSLGEVKFSKGSVISEIEKVSQIEFDIRGKLSKVNEELNAKTHLMNQIEKLEDLKREINEYSIGRKILNWKDYKKLKEKAKRQKSYIKELSKKIIMPSLNKALEEVKKIEKEKSGFQSELKRIESRENLLKKAVKTMEESERKHILKDYPEEIRNMSYEGALRLQKYATIRGGIVDYKDVYKHYDKLCEINRTFEAKIEGIKDKERNIELAEKALDSYLNDKNKLEKLEKAIFKFGKTYKFNLEKAKENYRSSENICKHYQREIGETFSTKKEFESIRDRHEIEVERIPKIRKTIEQVAQAIKFMDSLAKDINRCTNEPYLTIDKILKHIKEQSKGRERTENKNKERNRDSDWDRGRGRGR